MVKKPINKFATVIYKNIFIAILKKLKIKIYSKELSKNAIVCNAAKLIIADCANAITSI